MTQEEKAKAYDDAIKRAKRMFSEKELNYLFLELAESDDEKIISAIRKAIEAKVENLGNGVTRTACLAWLEKQGEPIDEEKVDSQNCVKPSVKGEPKFKVGDYVVDNCGYVWRIEGIINQFYILEGIDGGESRPTIEWVNKTFHLWDITEDAKEGDVLVDSLGNVCIYQEPSTKLMYHSHCYGNHKFFIPMGGSHEIVGSYPATKEQRDQLEKAMADAGYTFDFEKKELKEIEQKPPIVNFKARDWYVNKVDGKIYNAKFMEEPFTNQKRRLEIEKAAMSATGIIEQEEWFIKGAEWSDKNSSYISSEKQGEQKSFDYENTNIPQKDSTWSEEDKHWMQKVIDFMNHPDLIKATPTLAKDTINWLKSLKDRVQPQSKQEWSEEDESNFQMIIDVIKENKHHATDYEHMIYYKLLSWFKSLKERYVWEPSDEQIDALEHFVRSIGESGFASPYDDNTRLLYSLLEQLKKL